MANLGIGIIGAGNISSTYLRLAPLFKGLEPRDRGFAMALAMATLRRLGPIERALDAAHAAKKGWGRASAADRALGRRRRAGPAGCSGPRRGGTP